MDVETNDAIILGYMIAEFLEEVRTYVHAESPDLVSYSFHHLV